MIAAQIVKFLLDDLDTEVAKAAAQTDPHPTEDEKESGDYEKGEVTLHGLDIKVENAKGSTRSGTDKDGKPWSIKMPAHYGYVTSVDGETPARGKDKDEVDVYIGPNAENENVYVVNQNKIEGGFDEHKWLLGFDDKNTAVAAYDAGFSGDLGPKLRGTVVATLVADFKKWLLHDDHKKPFESVAESLISVLLRK